MKVFTLLLLLNIPTIVWAQKTDFDELGRALGNYQACSQVSITIKDELMFHYYQKMYNDISVTILSMDDAEGVKQLYLSWDESEKVLANLELESMKIICLSRFDKLTRKMLK